MEALRAGLRQSPPCPECAVSLLSDTSHAAANELMTADGLVDLLIPRGGAGLIRAVFENATVPWHPRPAPGILPRLRGQSR